MITHYYESAAMICGEELAVYLEYRITNHGHGGNGWDDPGEPFEVEIDKAYINEGSREGEDVLKYLNDTLAWDECKIKTNCRKPEPWLDPIQAIIFGNPYRIKSGLYVSYFPDGFYLEKVTQLQKLEAELYESQHLIDASYSDGEFYDG